MIGIELFCGAGGMSLGAEGAGIDVKVAIDNDVAAVNTYQLNHSYSNVIAADIRNVQVNQFTDISKGRKLLFGGPPCQGFSRSNHRTRTKLNPNNWLFQEFLRIAELLTPDWIVIENVEGLIGTEKGLFFKKIIESFKKLGYHISYKLLNSIDYGVPQRRNRLFIVGSKKVKHFQFPDSIPLANITVDNAIHDLPVLSNGNSVYEMNYATCANHEYAKTLRGSLQNCKNHGVSKNTDIVLERYTHIPEGGNWKDIPNELMHTYKDSSRCHTGIYHRLKGDCASAVIGNFRKNMLIHPQQNRGLSVREAARLQSFPDWYEFKGSLNQQQQQVGNAVPPKLAYQVFKKILEY